ncbi:hypothetical protein RJ640_008417 [Escallonia rubra]|uniref:RING-type E3 ubiquitin transferase n=1 Tax=Escallonia rubra TaxID=112253 RepID=A0AA88RI85_9ASTE|nr:hypothetical protein RJ640_008417 [Escallonia rubra]
MSVHDQATAAIISQIALAGDGAVLGLALAYVAVRSILKYAATSSALRKIRNAPSARVSDLRSLLSSSEPNSEQSETGAGELVVVRGTVEAKSAIDGGNWKGLRPNVIVSHETGEKGVILLRTQTCIYNEWRGFFGFTSDLRSLFSRSWKEQETSSYRTFLLDSVAFTLKLGFREKFEKFTSFVLSGMGSTIHVCADTPNGQKTKASRQVPFVLAEGGKWPHSDYVVVNMDGSRHPLPLTTVYHHLHPISASPYTFLQALFGHEYPVGLLDEEKLLQVGKDITAVGTCILKDGNPEIKSCKDLPYFLSELTKDQMVVDLAFRTRVLLWSGTVIGSVAIGVVGYAFVRNWNRFKEWRQQRQLRQQNVAASNEAEAQAAAEEETGNVPDGELCVICLMRRRRSAFIPCGHLVCCQRCALSVERDSAPKCPVCRQEIQTSVRIYDS